MDDDQQFFDERATDPQTDIIKSNNPNTDQQRRAAEAVIRGELDRIYDQAEAGQSDIHHPVSIEHVLNQIPTTNQSSPTEGTKKPEPSTPSNYQTTELPTTYQQSYHVDDTSTLNQNVDWQKYHSAWQNYYQKYYEYYFKQSLADNQAKLQEFTAATQKKYQTELAAREQQVNQLTQKLQFNSNLNFQDEALNDLRAKLKAKMVGGAKKVRKSNHFWPIATTVTVLLVFLFLQYNQLIVGNVMAYVRPGNVDPRTIVVNPTTSIEVGPEPLLIIPKINVEVPVVYDIPNDHDSTFEAMRDGVAQFAIPGADAHPGEIGNTVITGHSSNDVFDQGSYKFIFSQLDKLEKGDIIYANYKGVRHTYSVTGSELVSPNAVNKIVIPTNKPLLTLITCFPIGTAKQRLLVFAEQIAPDPNQAKPAETKQTEQPAADSKLPGETRGFFQRLFDL